MTKETIIENCQRLLSFLKINTNDLIIDDISPKGFLDCYSKLLDINGCENKGHSIFFIPNWDEFKEFREYVSNEYKGSFNNIIENTELKIIVDDSIGKEYILKAYAIFSFQYDGFYWDVTNK